MNTITAIIKSAFPKQAKRVLEVVRNAYDEKQRYWHGESHILKLLEQAKGDLLLQLTIIFHDLVYRPGATGNELLSATFVRDKLPEFAGKKDVVQAILESEWKNLPKSVLGKKLFALDCQILMEKQPLAARLEYELAIFKENQKYGLEAYRPARIGFLRQWGKKFGGRFKDQIEVAEAFQPTIALYPGSFNPFHFGHLSVLRNAERVFNQVVIAAGINRQKVTNGTVAMQTRYDTLASTLIFHQVLGFDTLLAKAIEKFPKASIVRSIRNGTDLDAELHWRRFTEELAPAHPVVWIGCEPTSQHISSSAVRELKTFDGKIADNYVPTAKDIYELGISNHVN